MVGRIPQWLPWRCDDTPVCPPFPCLPPRLPMTKERLIPLIVATAPFMENMDSTDDAGHEISGRQAVETSSRKGAAKAAAKAISETTEDARDQRLG